MAFAIASGLSPQAGIYCAIVTGFLISALGGSTTQIGGPTGAFVVVIAGIVAKYGLDGLFMCTMMAGVLLVFMGITGLGSTVRFIPRPVVIGFTNGIAVLIASTQIKDFFGLQLKDVPGEFLERMEALATRADTMSIPATALGVATVTIIVLCTRYLRRVPGAIVVLFLGTAVVALTSLPVETIGNPLRRHPRRPAGVAHPDVQAPADLPSAVPGPDGGPARGHRVAAVGRRVRPDDRRQAQPQRRVDGPGRG